MRRPCESSRALARRKASSAASPRAPPSPPHCKVAAEAPAGRGDPGDAAGYRRALSLDAAVRRHRRRRRPGALKRSRARPPPRSEHAPAPMDARRYAALPDPFPMWRGGVLHGARIAYETWGTLNAQRDNAILLFTGLSPPAHAAASAEDASDGWWQGMVGPGLAHRYATASSSSASIRSAAASARPAPHRSIRPPASAYRLSFPDLSRRGHRARRLSRRCARSASSASTPSWAPRSAAW